MKYRIEFKPLDRYFFGGEMTFGENKEKANYFAKSNLMPPPSTVLGALRYEVLRQKGLLNYGSDKRAEVEACIGAHSFSIEKALVSGEINSYGILKKISPLFISDTKTGNYFTAMPLDYGIEMSESSGKCYYSGKKNEHQIQLIGFDPKHCTNFGHWINKEYKKLEDILKERYEIKEGKNEKKNEKLWNVFTISEQIGILKDKSEEEDKDAFFKQQFITLHPDLSFVCTVEVNEYLSEGDSFVYMGANRSMFKMSITAITQANDLDFTSLTDRNYFYFLYKNDRIVLLGDAYITDELKNEALFIWGESTNFRSIQSSVDKPVSWAKPEKSTLYHLLQRGSVIYGAGAVEHLNMPNFQTVGMNIYV